MIGHVHCLRATASPHELFSAGSLYGVFFLGISEMIGRIKGDVASEISAAAADERKPHLLRSLLSSQIVHGIMQHLDEARESAYCHGHKASACGLQSVRGYGCDCYQGGK